MDYYDPITMADASGEVVERYEFSAFGMRSIMDAAWTSRADSDHVVEFAFHGQFLDAETGYYDYGYRYYSPQIGRWLSRDPVEESGGVNLYVFAENFPINGVDFRGLLTLENVKKSDGTESCDAETAKIAEEAITEAQKTVQSAVELLSNLTTENKRKYVIWFGTYAENRFSHVKGIFDKINEFFGGRIGYECCEADPKICTSNTPAYVVPGPPIDINLCPGFAKTSCRSHVLLCTNSRTRPAFPGEGAMKSMELIRVRLWRKKIQEKLFKTRKTIHFSPKIRKSTFARMSRIAICYLCVIYILFASSCSAKKVSKSLL